MSARFFELFALVAIVTLVGMGVARLLVLRARGVGVLAADRRRGAGPVLFDCLEAVLLLSWFYEIVAFSLPLPGAMTPPALEHVVATNTAMRTAGAVAMVASIALYGLALWAFGASWRIGIDRERAGPLVTGGVFARSRNPIYVSMNLFGLGSFLALGQLALLALALANGVLFHFLIRREERFLEEAHGDAYRRYCARVRRYLTLP